MRAARELAAAAAAAVGAAEEEDDDEEEADEERSGRATQSFQSGAKAANAALSCRLWMREDARAQICLKVRKGEESQQRRCPKGARGDGI